MVLIRSIFGIKISAIDPDMERCRKWFRFHKLQQDFISYQPDGSFHLIFYDAFDPQAQPEMWKKAIFKKLLDMLLPEDVLVTYSSNGQVIRSMQEAGFAVEKLPGPPHKREIVRALNFKKV